MQRLDEIVEDHVGHVLVEDPPVAERDEVELQALQLYAEAVGDVGDPDRPEVGLAGLRAHGRELRAGMDDRVVTAGMAVGEGLEVGHW